MADEPIKEAAPEVTPGVVVDNPHLDNVPQGNVAPNLDDELDNALNDAFKSQTNETKPVEKAEKSSAKVEKTDSKEDVKVTDKQQGELPTPESLEGEIPKKQQGWTALKNNYKRAHGVIAEREEEIKRLKSGLAEKGSLSTKEIEALRSEIKELSKYRTMVDIQADPEFISKYDQPISKIQGSIKEMLTSLSVSKEIVDQVDFSNTKLMDEIIGHVGEHRDKITARKLQRKIEEMVDLTDKRDETLLQQKTDYQGFMESKKKESSLKGAEEEGRMMRQLEARVSSQDASGNSIVPFMVKMTPKEGASQPEIDQASKHNRLVELMQQKVQEAIKINNPEAKADLALAAVGSYWLNAQLKTAVGRIKSLEEEIKKISNISSDTEKSKTKGPTRAAAGEYMDTDAALAAHFNK